MNKIPQIPSRKKTAVKKKTSGKSARQKKQDGDALQGKEMTNEEALRYPKGRFDAAQGKERDA